jgi:endonuclease/exonuclease/phosphatase family metal-dependent hydrolase
MRIGSNVSAFVTKIVPPVLFAVTFVGYVCIFIPPEKFWPAIICTFGILPLIFLNLILFIVLSFMKRKSLFWPLIILIIGIFFIQITFKFQFKKLSSENDLINVLSFNADFFHLNRNIDNPSIDLINWVVDDSSSIKCIQEYISYKNDPQKNISNRIIAKGYQKYAYLFEDSKNRERGLAIFSRYPIVNQGKILFNPGSKNNCIFIDVVFSEDTLRIYNLHLSSMSIPEINDKYLVKYGGYLKNIIIKLKNGAIKHSNEINALIKHTSECNYPYIICGDFNETPYSYNYLKLRNHYKNSFEEAGSGFGFSFNGRLFFLRIDHQFFSEQLKVLRYRVDHSILKSGHFPTRGIYEIKKTID